MAFWTFISFHFLLFWAATWGAHPQVAKNGAFPNEMKTNFISAETGCILQFLAFCASMSFHFGLLSIHFLSFWHFGLLFPFIFAFSAFISFHFGFFGLYFLSFWPFGPLFPFILTFSAFISFHFGLLGFYFLSFWPFGLSFPFILVFWAFISFHFGLLGLHFLSFWLFDRSFPFIFGLSGLPRGVPPTSCQKRPVSY